MLQPRWRRTPGRYQDCEASQLVFDGTNGHVDTGDGKFIVRNTVYIMNR